MQIPTYKSSLRRQHFINAIKHKPTECVFRGQPVLMRFDEMSQSRRMEIAGYIDTIVDLEVMVALPDASEKPQSRKREDWIEAMGETWVIYDVREDQGDDCYHLVVAKKNTH